MNVVKVTINGKPRELPHGMNLKELVLFLNLMPERAIIELNEAVIPKDRWAETVVAENDRLELVSLVGGG
jgi:sulfur carrier protein